MLSIRPAGSIIPLAAFFASRDVQAGEELTWDYGDASGEGWYYGRQVRGEALSALENKASQLTTGRLVCRCGSLQ